MKFLFAAHPRRWQPAAMVLAVLSLLVVACGGPTATSTAQPTQAVATAAGQATQAAATQPPIAAAGAGTLRVAMQPIVQTDPAFISSDSEVLVANHVYDYLVDVDAESNVQPRLASEWTISDDGLVYTFSLADGIAFHDGSPLTARDVVWTFNRLRDPALELPTADLYANIAGVEAVGEQQVVFTLNQPNPFFLYDLSDNHALVIKTDTTDPAAFNGTGPFRVVHYSPEDRIELAANPNYFVPDQPSLASVEIVFFNDEATAVNALRGGQVDLVMRMSTSLFTSLQAEPGITTLDIPTNGFDLIRLRADREPGSNPLVVQAMKLATDRQEILDLAQQGYGAVGRDSPIGPLYAAYYSEEAEIPARDPAAARALLEQAGYPNGLNLDLHTPDTGGRPDVAAILQDQWAEAGINLNIVVVPESVYYGDDLWLEVDLGITGWGSRPYPQFYLETMLVTGAVWNESHFSDPELDELAGLAATTLDEQQRIQAYRDIQALLIERGPVIVPYFFAQFAALRDGFEGFELKAFAGRTDFRTVVANP
jgi:peptide/nickel transport system substrate-binding protein